MKASSQRTLGGLGLLLCITQPLESLALDVEDAEMGYLEVRLNDVPKAMPFEFELEASGTGLEALSVTTPAGGIGAVLGLCALDGFSCDVFVEYASLAALQNDFPPGDYVLRFTGDGGTTNSEVTVSLSPVQPTGFLSVISPADGALGVSIDPTLVWSDCSACGGSSLGADLHNLATDMHVAELPLTADTSLTSWVPGTLTPNTSYELEVFVGNASHSVETTSTADAFNFTAFFANLTATTFTTEIVPLDIREVFLGHFEDRENDVSSVPPFVFEAEANGAGLEAFTLTTPAGGIGTIVGVCDGLGTCELGVDFPTSSSMLADFPPGNYVLAFTGEGGATTTHATVNLPATQPTGFVSVLSPAHNAVGVSLNPTIVWSNCSGCGGAFLEVFLFNTFSFQDEFELFTPDTSRTEWIPGLLAPGTTYEIEIEVGNGVQSIEMTSAADPFDFFGTFANVNLTVFSTIGDPDTDGDGSPDSIDNCPTVRNTAQTDTDLDGLGDACDNCRNEPNAEAIPAFHIGTGEQTDDDLDGIGNVCDADFDGSGFMNVTDLLRFLDAFGKNIADPTCLDDAGSSGSLCGRYDLNVTGPVINVSDLLRMISPDLFGTSTDSQGCAIDDLGFVRCPLP